VRFSDRLFARLNRWLGVEQYDAVPVDRLLQPRPELPQPFMTREMRARIMSGIEACPHFDSDGIDETAGDDPTKVWRCRGCGLTYRNVVRADKPWFILHHEPVAVTS
jgi:hypothetical protein